MKKRQMTKTLRRKYNALKRRNRSAARALLEPTQQDEAEHGSRGR